MVDPGLPDAVEAAPAVVVLCGLPGSGKSTLAAAAVAAAARKHCLPLRLVDFDRETQEPSQAHVDAVVAREAESIPWSEQRRGALAVVADGLQRCKQDG